MAEGKGAIVEREHVVNSTDQRQTGRRIVIVGAGPGGICMGIKLLEAGHKNFIILEKADGVGGTWWHNRYPGAACDLPSHLYSFTFALKQDWSRPYAQAPEIQRYMAGLADAFGVRPHVRLNTEVTAAHWREDAGQWHVCTATGEVHEADVLVAAQGMFNEIAWPAIPGLSDYQGHLFHSARWEHDHDMRERRVGVIGSAASAVQFVPEIAPNTRHLTVFQRTANWVLPKHDDPYDEDALAYYRANRDAVLASREKILRDLEGFVLFDEPERLAKFEALGLRNLEQVRDPVTRAKLKPTHPYGCKRPLNSNKWFPTFNRDNVALVTEPIERITARGIRTADGMEHELDTIIAATGFDVFRFASAIEVIGRAGRRLDEAWHDGAQAYLGITTAGFPNLFQIYGPNTNNNSILHMIECQTGYITRQIGRLEREQLVWMDVRPDVMAEYNEGVQRDALKVKVWFAGCPNYYRAPSGRVVTQYPHKSAAYHEQTTTPDPDAYEVFPPRRATA